MSISISTKTISTCKSLSSQEPRFSIGVGSDRDACTYLAKIPSEKNAPFALFDEARFTYALEMAADLMIHGSFEERIDTFLFIVKSRQNDQISETSQLALANKIQELNEANAFDDLDLSHLDLSGKNLSDLKLRFAYMMNADLSGADLTNTDLTESRLYAADLTNADLTRVVLFNTTLEGAVMSNTKLNPENRIRTDLTELQLAGLVPEAPSPPCSAV